MVEGEKFVEGRIFRGEGVRPRRSSGEKGEFNGQFWVTKYVITC